MTGNKEKRKAELVKELCGILDVWDKEGGINEVCRKANERFVSVLACKTKQRRERIKTKREQYRIQNKEDQKRETLLNCITVGDNGVGKNALALRFSKGVFFPHYKNTFGYSFHTKPISIKTAERSIHYKLQLWHSEVLERFRIRPTSTRPMYFKGPLGALIIFDLTNYVSFKHIPQWIDFVRANTILRIPLLLVGNKSDLGNQRAVSMEEINQFARHLNLHYIETSAKTGEGVNNCFYILICLILGLEVPKQLLDSKDLDKDSKPPSGDPKRPPSAKSAALVDF